MSNSPVNGLTSEERYRLIADHLRPFNLPQKAIDWICPRMVYYVETFLCPPAIHLDFQQFSGLPSEEIEKIQKAFSQINTEIREWKGSIYRERLFLKVAFGYPDAFLLVFPNDREGPTQ